MSLTTYEPIGRRATCTCMILVRDEAHTIGRAIESALGSRCFDLILILIDVRSSDGTGRIVYEYAQGTHGVRIVPYKWAEPPDFAAARNYHLSLVRTQYALWLDGDEEIVEPAALRSMLTGAKGQAFWVYVRSPLAGGGMFDMYQPRLIPVVPGLQFECAAYERIDWSLKRAGVPSVHTDVSLILHSGYVDPDVLQRKNRRNTASLRRALGVHRGDTPQRVHMEKQYRALRV